MIKHKPLISMLNNPRAQAPFCIKRIKLKLGFCYTVEHINGASPQKRNSSDYLSRHTISATKEDLRKTEDLQGYVNYIFQSLVIEPAISLDELKDVSNKDRVALILKTAIENVF